LAYACMICNRYKGSDIGSILWKTEQFVRFFNPRKDRWKEHFKIEEAMIISITDIGRVTSQIFRFNDMDRIKERMELISLGRYPISPHHS
jgi:hypothetical protein